MKSFRKSHEIDKSKVYWADIHQALVNLVNFTLDVLGHFQIRTQQVKHAN